MTGLIEEDWISPSVFTKANKHWSLGKGSCFIQLHNKTDQLKTCDPGSWRWKGGKVIGFIQNKALVEGGKWCKKSNLSEKGSVVYQDDGKKILTICK